MAVAPCSGLVDDCMEVDPSVLDSLRKAVEAMPGDVPLRVHLATMLMGAGLRDEAIRQVGAILQREPGNAAALALLQEPGRLPAPPQAGLPGHGPVQPEGGDFDWSRAESEVQDVVPPMFVGGGPEGGDPGTTGEDPAARAFDVERAELRLAD